MFNIVSFKSPGLYFAKFTLGGLPFSPHRDVFIKEYGRFYVPIHSIHVFFLKCDIDILPMRGEFFVAKTDHGPAVVTRSKGIAVLKVTE